MLVKLSAFLGALAAVVVGLGLAMLLMFRFVPIPVTPLMAWRAVDGYGWNYQWTPLEAVPEHVPRAVIASEDARYCEHYGVDLSQLRLAVQEWMAGERVRGASTLTMQTTKNVFLWHGRSYLRKALEIPMAPVLERIWGKRRVLEVYLNIAELGPGVYGFGAAAQHHFGKEAGALTPQETALLVAILPSPLSRSAAEPGNYTSRRARQIAADIPVVDLSCIE